ncbi:MAG: aspartate aminotransferase family protein [Patescibacteria group bacterium]|nr:aspartate aminotransferase family protein [Patescibacteria group bacterium]
MNNINEELHPFHSWGMKIVKAEGVYLYDETGKRFIDLTSSASVVNIGYANKEVIAAIRDQLNKLIFCPPSCMSDEAEELSRKLIKLFPKYLNTILRVTTGSESVEVALKLAKKYTKRSKFLSFEHSYHGHTIASMAIGMNNNTKKDFLPLIESDTLRHPHITKGVNVGAVDMSSTLDEIEVRLSTRKYAAFVTETMATSAGNYMLSENFFIRLREICDKYGTLLIIDEVLTGFGRTGKMFSFERFGIRPDIVCIAKGLGCGYAPIAATITKGEIAKGFDYFATFAWNPLACKTASVVLDEYERLDLVTNSDRIGSKMLSELQKQIGNNLNIKEIRGLGLRISIEFNEEEFFKKVKDDLLSKGIFPGTADLPNILTISPPLCITSEEMDYVIANLINIVNNE